MIPIANVAPILIPVAKDCVQIATKGPTATALAVRVTRNQEDFIQDTLSSDMSSELDDLGGISLVMFPDLNLNILRRTCRPREST